MNVYNFKFESHQELAAFNAVWQVTLTRKIGDNSLVRMVISLRDYLEIKFRKSEMTVTNKSKKVQLREYEAIALHKFIRNAMPLLEGQIGEYESNTIQRKFNELDQICA